MKRFLILAILFPLIIIITHADGVSPNLSLNLISNKLYFNTTEPIAMALTVLNTSNAPCKVTFSSSFVFDFALTRDDQPVWKWSDGKMFAQAIKTVELLPNKPHTYLFVYNPGSDETPKLAPGKYKLIGSLQTISKTYLSDPIWIEIRK